MNNPKIVDFRFAKTTDDYDSLFKQDGAWSRIYEYHYVLNYIRGYSYKNVAATDIVEHPEIHNTSWGFEGIHVTFRDELDRLGKCVHSDIVHSDFRDTYYYDITTVNQEFENKFDFVINVSTIEHLNSESERKNAIENLFRQVKVGGYLIMTFDYPRVKLVEIETLIGTKCELPVNALNGENSVNPNKNYKDLNIVYLILQKNE